MCTCKEAYIDYRNGTPQPNNLDAHDCDYIAWRDSLIPRAEKRADELYSRYQDSGAWSLEFVRQMELLCNHNK